MLKYTESQNKIIVTAHTVVAFVVVLAFIALGLWLLLKGIVFASPILIPVAVAFFMALFFMPYYRWWEKRIPIRPLALAVMLLTVLLPFGALVWCVGSALVRETTELVRQMPDMVGRFCDWLETSFPAVNDLFAQVTSCCHKLLGFVADGEVDAANPVLAVTNTVPAAAYEAGNAMTETCADGGVQMTNSLSGGIGWDVDKLRALYAAHGDFLKDAGMKLCRAGGDAIGTAGDSVNAVASTPGGAEACGPVAQRFNEAWGCFCGALSALCSGAAGLFRAALQVLITTIFFVFFILAGNCRGGRVADGIPLLKDSTRKFVADKIDVLTDILVGFYQRQVLICLLEGVLYGFGFALVGVQYGFVLGFLLGVVNLVPFLGTVVFLPFVLMSSYFGADGSGCRLLLALLVWGFGQFLDGYLITPKIQGDKTGLGYVGVIFSFFLWGTILGPLLGMLFAIPLSACCVVLWRAVLDITKPMKIL